MATKTTRSHDKNNTYKKKPRIRISSLSPEMAAAAGARGKYDYASDVVEAM
jgi:hypothetical protein